MRSWTLRVARVTNLVLIVLVLVNAYGTIRLTRLMRKQMATIVAQAEVIEAQRQLIEKLLHEAKPGTASVSSEGQKRI